MLRALVYIVPIGLAIYALIDLSRSGTTERMGLHPLFWVAVIVLLPVVGPLVWVIVSKTQRGDGRAGVRAAPGTRPTGGPAPARAPRWPARRPGPVAPDDDPEFLWRLEQQQRRAGHQSDAQPNPPTEGETPAPTTDEDPKV